MKIIIRLYSEVTLKSPSMRKHLVNLLRRNVQKSLSRVTPDFKVTGGWDHLAVVIPDDNAVWEKVAKVLSSISGIEFFFRVKEVPFTNFDDTLHLLLSLFSKELTGKTFCVRAKRIGTHHFSSMEMERVLGAGILAQVTGTKVSLDDPEVTISLELRDQRLLVPLERRQGVGGMPVGSEGKVLMLISGGFDSSVAAQMMMNRGCRVDYLFFNLGGVSHQAGVLENVYYLWQKFSANYPSKIHVVPFEPIISELLQSNNHRYRGVLLKRMMFRVASRIAKKYRYKAFVTGECMAQVSSQTLTNLPIITQAAEVLALRPLLAMNKPEIIQRAKQIGTARFAEKMPEYCGAVSDKPTAEAKMKDVIAEEEKFNLRLLETVFDQHQVIRVHEIPELEISSPVIPEVAVYKQQEVIIDLREPEEQAEIPLQVDTEVLIIPFFQLDQHLPLLDPAKDYLLFCERGVLSRAHAESMQQKGYRHVKIFRPKGDHLFLPKTEKDL